MQAQGYLARETVNAIAAQFQVSPSQVYAIASFYQQFSFTPKGKYAIAVCLGTACYIKGAPEILTMLQDELGIQPGEVTPDGKFSIERNTRCLGQCAAAPIVQINDTVYAHATAAQIREVIRGLR